jgi:hypothetical protein
MLNNKKVIGGEFEYLCQNQMYQDSIFKNKSFFLSGRSALKNIIWQYNTFKNIYIPYFACKELKEIICKRKINLIYYDVDKRLKPTLVNEKKDSIILIIDYFGKKNSFTSKKKNLIIRDISHSWIDYTRADYEKNEVFFCSLRKHGIYNIGGWNSLNLKKNDRFIKTDGSVKYIKNLLNLRKKKHKLIQINNFLSPSIQYLFLRKFSNIEKKLTKNNNLINKKFLQYITNYNLQDIKKIRKSNFNFLISNINSKNVLNLNYNNETPLFFNLRLRSKKKRDYLRTNLKKQNIFCPVHWKLRYNNKYPLSSDMSSRILSIPIDQRYKLNDMKIIANTINKLL